LISPKDFPKNLPVKKIGKKQKSKNFHIKNAKSHEGPKDPRKSKARFKTHTQPFSWTEKGHRDRNLNTQTEQKLGKILVNSKSFLIIVTIFNLHNFSGLFRSPKK
jgi:hypothetical protein